MQRSLLSLVTWLSVSPWASSPTVVQTPLTNYEYDGSGWYRIVNVQSRFAMSMDGLSAGSAIVAKEVSDDDDTQIWELVANGQWVFMFGNGDGNLATALEKDRPVVGTSLSTEDGRTLWLPAEDVFGRYNPDRRAILLNSGLNQVLEDTTDMKDPKPGAPLVMRDGDSRLSQAWLLERVV